MTASATGSSFLIAPGKYNHHWTRLSPTLKGADAATWKSVVDEYYFARLKSRYLDPIESIRDHGNGGGEGFAMMAIQCSLIEFLESCVQGTNYKNKGPLGPYEYSQSGQVFVSFLTQRDPFRSQFSEALAKDFYSEIRCGVLHEARTKGPWRIWEGDGSGTFIEPVNHIVFRNDFQIGLNKFIDQYRADLPGTPALQEAFLRKYDELAK